MVIAVGKETISMILPAMAGLTKFCPIPPKNCFATTIAITEPIAAIQSGIETGRLNASISPVTTALRSPIVLWRFITFLAMYSERTLTLTVTAHTSSTRRPKSHTDAASAGISAIITLSIMPLTVCAERT